MDSSFLDEQDALIFGARNASLIFTLEHGLRSIQQERYAEGIAFLAQTREQLSPDQFYLSAAIDAFMQSHTLYWQAQQALHCASQRFAETAANQQTHLTTLHNLLTTLVKDKEATLQSSNGVATPSLNVSQQYQAQEPVVGKQHLPELYITCFGQFEVRQSGKPLVLCSNRCGQSILRFLVARPQHYATSDTLLTLLWPEDPPETALNKLHIAISALRRSLNQGYGSESGRGYIVCKNRIYSLNPAVTIHTDLEEFLHYYQMGQQAKEERIAFYEKACGFYTGPFLSEEIYADWSFPRREELNQAYLSMCKVLAEHYLQCKHYDEAIRWTVTILNENRCDEGAYRQLMQIYAAQDRRSEALQQYQRCKLVLHEELGVQPLPETTLLFQSLLAEPSSAQ